MIAAVVTIIVIDLLKIASFQPRPYYVSDQVRAWRGSPGLGMPSGHAAVALCVWGTLALSQRSRTVTLIAIVLIALVGISRIYLGVHSPSQVMLGWAVGLGLLSMMQRCERHVVSGFRSWSLGRQLTLALITTLGLMALKWLLIANVELHHSVPKQWEIRHHRAQIEVAAMTGTHIDAGMLYLFRSVGADHFLAFMGVWFVLIYVAQQGGFGPFSPQESFWNYLLGIGFVVAVVAVVRALDDTVWGVGFVACAVPFLMAVVIPTAGMRLASRGKNT